MISFYNLSEYHNWKNENNDGKGWYNIIRIGHKHKF